MRKDTLLIELQYFMNICLFKNLFVYTNVHFELFENNVKAGIFNRAVIAGANGTIILSVPLKKGRNQRTSFKDLEILNEEKWQLRHWRSIVSSYNGSPWFGYYKDELAGLFSKPYHFLIDWNLECMEWVLAKLALEPSIHFTSVYLPPAAVTADFIDMRHATKTWASSANDGTTIVYQQVFQDRHGFLPGLSILDLLFCEGPKRAKQLLQESIS